MNPELLKELSIYAKGLILNLEFDRLDKMRYVFNFTDEDFKKLILETYNQSNKQDVLTANSLSTEDTSTITNSQPIYLLRRLVLGAELVNVETQKVSLTLRESFFHHNDFEDGDLVTLDYEGTRPVLTRLGQKWPTVQYRIGVFNKGIIRKSLLDDTYYIEDNINGELLGEVNATERRYTIGRELPKLGNTLPKEGDTVDLAWELGKPSIILQRRWYFGEELPEKEEPKVVKKQESSKKEEDDSTSMILDFDLSGKKVGLVLGDGMRSGLMSYLVVEHGGVPIVLDAHRYQGRESAYKRKLKDCDAVAVTKALRNVTKELGIGYAMANGVGFAQIEKAIYRAINGLQVDEVGASIDYPLLPPK